MTDMDYRESIFVTVMANIPRSKLGLTTNK